MAVVGCKVVDLAEFGRDAGPLPQKIRVQRHYVDHNGYFVTDTVWVKPEWQMVVCGIRDEHEVVFGLFHIVSNEQVNWLVNAMFNNSLYELRSADKIVIRLDANVTDEFDPAFADNCFNVVGWGMRPALGLTLIFVIARLLVFKNRVMEKYYHPSGKWLLTSTTSFEFVA